MTPEERKFFFDQDYQTRVAVRNRMLPLSEKALVALEKIIVVGKNERAIVQACNLVLGTVSGMPIPQSVWESPCPEKDAEGEKE